QKAKKYSKRILLGFLSLMILGTINVSAQVSFTQTLNADFYKGAYNDLLVGSDNVYLPYQATDVNNWLTTTVLPQTLEGHKAATWNNRYVYVVGGYNDVTYSSSVYRATLTTGGISSWTTVNSLPVGLRDHAVVIGTNTIYVLGGRDDTNIYDEIYAATINSDGSLGTWDLLSVTLPETLWGHTAAYCGGYIYVVGGSNVMSSTYALPGVYYSEVQADNSLTSFATNVAMVEGRNGHSMVVHGTTFYILGGYNDFGNKKNTVLYNTSQLNGQLTVWSYATSLPIAISNHSSVIMNGLITVLAGESGGTLSNSIYYADINASPLVWNLATNIMYDRTKDGAAFATNGWIGYCGGENLSGTPIHNTRYANLTLSAGYEKNGFFVSNPFYELGAERLITELTFSASNPATSNTQIAYRTAGDDLDWGNWSALTSTSPITIGFTDHYLQYKIVFTGDGLVTPTFQEMNLWTPGTELAGNLNGWTTFDLASSPYWVTADISFTGGTHTFDAGVELNFLPQTGMSVSQANIICNGTVSDSVRFKGYTSEIGLWDGIYFDPNSDNGVSSQFYYTVIEGAGYGSWNANLYCNSTNEPLLMHCSLRGADGHGLNLNASHLTIEETFFGGNTESGVYLNNSNPSFLNSEMSNNQFAGIYLSSPASEPNFYTVLSENNTYAMYYPSPNFTILPPNGTGLTFTGNTYNGICIEEGNVSDNQVWNSIVYDYIMLGNLSIGKYGDVCRLTIEPGNTVKFLSGKYFMIGFHSGYHHGGELYAIGTVDSTITFTPHDGTSGGWEGIYFEDRSDYWGATSVMDYCLVEKGNAYNMFIENTTMPTILNSEIRDAVQDGIKCYAAYNSIETSTFSNNGRYPLYFAEPLTSPTLTGNTWTGNTINLIGYSGGAVNESRTLQNDGIGYHILGDINIGRYNDFRRLTVEPGLTLFFDPGTKIQVGFLSGYHHGGELYAEGTVGSPITFTSYDGVAGSWNGIYFEDRSDWSGATNSLKNCIIEKGNDYNIFCELTGSVTIDSCTIRDAVTDGLRYSGSYGSFTNSTFENNGRYPVYFMDWVSEPWHKDNTFNSKGINYIALAGGYYTDNRTIYSDNVEYLVLGSIFVGKYADKCRLTIEPDVTLNFDATIYLQVGYPSGYHYGGELYAEGNTDSLITFRPYNNAIGGWEGIYFEDRSDYSGATSSLKYCLIEKGDSYNVYCENTSQPTFKNCELTNAAGDGLNCYNASPG
ncbi:MAG: right-handed parallel beta-helix repeat-containing protein, partial [Bacteroidetes bacterium]|nr:right-handed parallel beta-helix repeat-containing protein [Bacteroidota bacterium]